MKVISFENFVAEQGQVKAAVFLGVTQGAISKALRLGRKIKVTCHDDGTFSAEEVRTFPAQPARVAS